MPATHSYPGVYVEELPPTSRSIALASTSNTAFVDFFLKGEVGKPVRITSFAEFESTFGGVDPQSEASWAIRQYYDNGGSVAFVVNVAKPPPNFFATVTLAGGAGNALTVTASLGGEAGNNIELAVKHGPAGSNVFHLAVRRLSGGKVVAQEVHTGLDVTDADKIKAAMDKVNLASRLVTLTALTALPKETPMVNALNPADIANTDKAFTKLELGTDKKVSAAELRKGIGELDKIAPEVFNLLCVPAIAGLSEGEQLAEWSFAARFCADRRAFLLVDPGETVTDNETMRTWNGAVGNLVTPRSNAAVYYPRVVISDGSAPGGTRVVGGSGTMAGIYAVTDAQRGVWKSPAGIDARLAGAKPELTLTDLQQGEWNPLGVNVLRVLPVHGAVSWGARTLEGADQATSQWKYVAVRRLAYFVEQSLSVGLKWVVFEPNDPRLWSQIRLSVDGFLHTLFLQGAFQGSRQQAYSVECDAATTTQADIDAGLVNIIVRFAPLKPAEFVVLKIQQAAGQTGN